MILKVQQNVRQVKAMDRYEQTNRVAVLGISANIVLMILKLTIGIISRSQAMIADGLNSVGDVFASLMTYTGNKIASKPRDSNHPYGHGKAEYIFSMIISFSLLLVAYEIMKNSIDAIFNRREFYFSMWLVGVAVFTIITKLLLFLYTRRIGRKQDNLLIVANSEDHRNDVMVTSSALIGFYMGSHGIYWLDSVAGIGIAIWIAFTGIRIFLNSFTVLMDTSIDKVLKADIINAILKINGVSHVDSVSAKPVGVAFIVIVKVSVPGNISVLEGHSVAARIKERLKEFKGINDVLVHINPTNP